MQEKELNHHTRQNSSTSPPRMLTETDQSPRLIHRPSKTIVSSSNNQLFICKEILSAFNNEYERQAEKHIMRLPRSILKEQFQIFSMKYHDIKFRRAIKIDTLNIMLDRLGSLNMLQLEDAKLRDGIKQLNINAFNKVIKMLNLSKVFCFYIKNQNFKLSQPEIMKRVPKQYMKTIDDLRNFLHDYNVLSSNTSQKAYISSQKKIKEKDKQIQKLQSEIQFIKNNNQKNKVRGINIGNLDETYINQYQQSMQKDIFDLQKKIQEFVDENIRLQSILQMNKVQILNLSDENSRLNERNKQLQSSQLKEIAKLRAANHQKVKDIHHIQNKYNKVLLERDHQLRQKQKILNQKISELKTAQDNYKKKQKQIQGMIQKENHLSLQLRKMEENEPMLKVFQQKNVKLDEELKMQKQLRTSMDQSYRAIQQKIEVANNRITQLQKMQYYIKTLNQGLQLQLKGHKAQWTSLKDKNQDLNNALEKLRQEKDIQIQKLVFQRKEIEKIFDKQRQQLNNKIHKEIERSSQIEYNLSKINKISGELSRQIFESQNQISKLNFEIEGLKSERSSLQLQLRTDKEAHYRIQRNLNQLLQQYCNHISQNQTQRLFLQANLDQAKEEIKEKDNVQKDLLKEISKYREKEAQLQNIQMIRIALDQLKSKIIEKVRGIAEICNISKDQANDIQQKAQQLMKDETIGQVSILQRLLLLKKDKEIEILSRQLIRLKQENKYLKDIEVKLQRQLKYQLQKANETQLQEAQGSIQQYQNQCAQLQGEYRQGGQVFYESFNEQESSNYQLS